MKYMQKSEIKHEQTEPRNHYNTIPWSKSVVGACHAQDSRINQNRKSNPLIYPMIKGEKSYNQPPRCLKGI